MSNKKKSLKLKLGIYGAIILPILYLILLFFSNDLDGIIFVLGPFGIIVWLIQWISWIIGGWILAIISTTLFFALLGFLLGLLVGAIVSKIKNKKNKTQIP